MGDDKKQDSTDEVDDRELNDENSKKKGPAPSDSVAPADDDIIIK